jgi:hypothetical protein
MEERKLDFERNKVEVLTLPELKQTYKEVAPNGQPAFGMYHFEARVTAIFFVTFVTFVTCNKWVF